MRNTVCTCTCCPLTLPRNSRSRSPAQSTVQRAMNYFLGSVAAGLTAAVAGAYAAEAFSEGQGYGGHEENFVYETDHTLVCMVCAKPFREPQKTQCCRQNFCESCLRRWAKKNGRRCCPHCRAEGRRFTHSLNHTLKEMVEELEVRCRHYKKGCEWAGQLRHLQRHLVSDSGCGFVEVECPNRCKRNWLQRLWPGDVITDIKRRDLPAHLRHECELRPYQCEHCHVDGTYKDITESHYDLCPEYPLQCPNRCGAREIKRKNVKSHRSRCPQEPMKCHFEDVGCNSDLRRCNYDGHMTSKQQEHLLLVMKGYSEMKERLERVEKELEETKKKLKAVKR